MKVNKIAVIAGDGIGPEVIGEAILLLRHYAEERGFPIELWELDLGAERYLRDGVTLPPDVRTAIEKSAPRCCSAL